MFLHSFTHIPNIHTRSYWLIPSLQPNIHVHAQTGSKLTVRGAGSVSNARRLQVQTLQCKSCFTCACIAHACAHVLQSVESHTHTQWHQFCVTRFTLSALLLHFAGNTSGVHVCVSGEAAAGAAGVASLLFTTDTVPNLLQVILLGFTCAYLAKQSLALPGSPLFNLLGGALVLILLAVLVQQYQY